MTRKTTETLRARRGEVERTKKEDTETTKIRRTYGTNHDGTTQEEGMKPQMSQITADNR